MEWRSESFVTFSQKQWQQVRITAQVKPRLSSMRIIGQYFLSAYRDTISPQEGRHTGDGSTPNLRASESSHRCGKPSTGSATGLLPVRNSTAWEMCAPSVGILGLQRACGVGRDGAAEQKAAASCQQGSLAGGRLPRATSSPRQACLVSRGSRHGQVSGNKCFKSLILLPAK